MTERYRSPIDPESAKFSEENEIVYAIGRDEHEGRIFVFLENLGNDAETASQVASTRHGNELDIFVLGEGIDEEQSEAQKKAIRVSGQIGLWAGSPTLIEIVLKNKKIRRFP